MKRNRFRLIIDITMAVLLPMLMAYSLIGEMFHEIIGTLIFLLFIIHLTLNRRWYGNLFRGRYDASRIFRTVIDILLLVFMFLQPLSGILISKYLYTFLPALPVSALARSIHLVLAYWGFVLMCIHAGTHLVLPLRKLFSGNRRIFLIVCLLIACISLYGCYAFVTRGFPGYMFMSNAFAFFDPEEPRILFFLDHISVMILFMAAGCLLTYVLGRTGRQKMSQNV